MIASHTLHGIAWLSLRVLPPLKALSLTRMVGERLSPLSPTQATHVASRLRGGTCLSRSIVIAARLPNATVVIGGSKNRAFLAHAWVEIEGRPLSGQTTLTDVLVRLAQ